MFSISKQTLDRATLNPFHKAFNLFPGNFLLEKWKDSRAQAVKDIEALTDARLKESLLAEVYAIKDAPSWATYIIKKYGASFETK